LAFQDLWSIRFRPLRRVAGEQDAPLTGLRICQVLEKPEAFVLSHHLFDNLVGSCNVRRHKTGEPTILVISWSKLVASTMECVF